MHKARPMLIGQGKYKTRSGRASWGTTRSGVKNKLSGGVKGGGGFHTTHMFHFGTARSHSGVDQKAKLQLLKQFIMETE